MNTKVVYLMCLIALLGTIEQKLAITHILFSG